MIARFLPIFAIVATLMLCRASPAQVRVLTLDEAVRMALVDHPSIQAARLDSSAAKESEGVALAGFLPQVGLAAAYQRTTANFSYQPGITEVAQTPRSNSGATYNYFVFGATLVQPIWDFGRTLGAYRAAQAQTVGARLGVEVSMLDRWASVVAQYYGVLAAQRLVEVATRTRDAVKRHAEVSEAFYKVGSRPRLDMVRARAEAAAAEGALGVATQGLDLARSALLTAIGMEQRFAYTVAPVGTNLAGPMPELEAAVTEALARRPERERLKAGVTAAEARVTQVMGDWFPFLTAGMGLTDAGTRINQMAWNWNVNVGLSYPVFSGLATWRAYRAAKLGLEAMKTRMKEFDLTVRAEVEQARLRVVETTARLVPLQAGVEAAKEALRLAEERYKAGEGNAVEFMDARRGSADAETEIVRAEYDIGLAWTALKRALGSMPVHAEAGAN